MKIKAQYIQLADWSRIVHIPAENGVFSKNPV